MTAIIIGMVVLIVLLILGAYLLFRHAIKNDDEKFISISNLSQARKVYNQTDNANRSIIYVDMKFDALKDVHSKTEIGRAIDFCNINLLNTVKKGLGQVIALIEDSSFVVVGNLTSDEFTRLCEYFYDEISKYIVQNRLSETPVVKFGMYTPRDSAVKFEEGVLFEIIITVQPAKDLLLGDVHPIA